MLQQNVKIEEKPFRSRYGRGLKTISAVIVIAFLLQDFASAQGGTPIWQNVAQSKSSVSGPETQLNKITIPQDAGLTRKVAVNGTDYALPTWDPYVDDEATFVDAIELPAVPDFAALTTSVVAVIAPVTTSGFATVPTL